MRSLPSSFTCQRRRTPPPLDTTTWAADVLAHPDRYGATAREVAIVADLLAQIGAAR